MLKATLTLCSALVLGAALAPAPASASDDKSYHASQCQASDGIESDFNRSEYRITRTGSQGGGYLMCPVIRDVFSCDTLIGGCVHGATARVKVYDITTSGQVSCSFSARNETGSSVYYSSDATSVALAPGLDTLVMHGGYPTGDGTYALRCRMPTNDASGYTKIYGYKVEESN